MMNIENQRLRNLTTGILHTTMDHVYEDIEILTGEKGVMTHLVPNAHEALQPWLKEKLQEGRFWNNIYDTKHKGITEIEPMNENEKEEFFVRFRKLKNPLQGFRLLDINK